ncbi:MAG TPA: hypothetical protein VK654_02475 [Nitrospirota bacterium]|nr:hypothetical protein [Nitrospirota bacterium]
MYWKSVVVFVLAILSLNSCQRKEAEALLEKAKTNETAKLELQQRPSNFIIAGDWDTFDKGVATSYTKATAIVFANRSAFDIDEIRGSITYLSAEGSIMATVPFAASGLIRASEALKVPVRSSEIDGAAKTAAIFVERVHIVDQ